MRWIYRCDPSPLFPWRWPVEVLACILGISVCLVFDVRESPFSRVMAANCISRPPVHDGLIAPSKPIGEPQGSQRGQDTSIHIPITRPVCSGVCKCMASPRLLAASPSHLKPRRQVAAAKRPRTNQRLRLAGPIWPSCLAQHPCRWPVRPTLSRSRAAYRRSSSLRRRLPLAPLPSPAI